MKTPVSISFDEVFINQIDKTAKAWNMNRSACIAWLCTMSMNHLQELGFEEEVCINAGTTDIQP